MKRVLVAGLNVYKQWLSPLFPASCRFVPTCSEYAAEAIAVHGSLYGSALTIWRILRCQPFFRGGHDPVQQPVIHSHTSRHSS